MERESEDCKGNAKGGENVNIELDSNTLCHKQYFFRALNLLADISMCSMIDVN